MIIWRPKSHASCLFSRRIRFELTCFAVRISYLLLLRTHWMDWQAAIDSAPSKWYSYRKKINGATTLQDSELSRAVSDHEDHSLSRGLFITLCFWRLRDTYSHLVVIAIYLVRSLKSSWKNEHKHTVSPGCYEATSSCHAHPSSAVWFYVCSWQL